MCCNPTDSKIRGEDGYIPGSSLANLLCLTKFLANERSCLKQGMEDSLKNDTGGCPLTSTPIHVHKHNIHRCMYTWCVHAHTPTYIEPYIHIHQRKFLKFDVYIAKAYK